MFEHNKKIQFIKDKLGTREKYHEIITNHSFTNDEKDILLQASVNISKSKRDETLINKAYNILISKSIRETTANKNFNMDFSLLKYLLIGGFLFMLFYLFNFNDTNKQDEVIVKLGDIAGQGFLRTKGGSVRTCAGNSVYIEKSNPNGFIIQSEILQEKKNDLKYFEEELRSEKYSLEWDEKTFKRYSSEADSSFYKSLAEDKKVEISKSKKIISELEQNVLNKTKKFLNQQAVVYSSIKDNIHETMCDAQGNYEFTKVEVGKYYITTIVQWYVGDDKQGGVVSKIITVKEGKNKIMITE